MIILRKFSIFSHNGTHQNNLAEAILLGTHKRYISIGSKVASHCLITPTFNNNPQGIRQNHLTV